MINFSEETDKKSLKNLLDNEALNVQVIIEFEQTLKMQIINYSNAFISSAFVNNPNPNLDLVSEFFKENAKLLKKLSSSFKKCYELSDNLNELRDFVSSQKKYQTNIIKTKIDEYNRKFTSLNKKITTETTEIQTLFNSCQKNSIYTKLLAEKELKNSNISMSENNVECSTMNNSDINIDINETKNSSSFVKSSLGVSKIVENTLIISEKDGIVVLPYTLKELGQKLREQPTKYHKIEDVIKLDYTIPFDYYKNSSLARFKEAFKLVKERNNGSFKHALDLAFELMFNYSLHPAIISDCKTVDELDIYLSCLEYDELEDFKSFKIIYDSLPSVLKRRKLAKEMK
jgi:hypothetical protein